MSGIGQRYRQFCILSKILCAMRYVRDPVQGRNRPRRMRRCRALPSTPSWHEHLHLPMHVRGLSRGLGVSVKASRERSRFDRMPERYPLGGLPIFDNPRRGSAESACPSPWAVGPEPCRSSGCAAPALVRPVGGPPAVSNRGSRLLHPEPAGLRPLAIQRSGPKQPAHIGHQRSRR